MAGLADMRGFCKPIAGFGAFRIASFLLVFNPSIYQSCPNPDTHIIFYLFFSVTSLVAFALAAIWPSTAYRLFAHGNGRGLVIATASSFAVVGILFAGTASGFFSAYLTMPICALCTAFWALFSAGWGLVFARERNQRMAPLQLALAIALEGVASPLCGSLPFWMQIILIGALLLLSSSMLRGEIRGDGGLPLQLRPAITRESRRLYLHVIVVSVVLGFLTDFCSKTVSSNGANGDYLMNLGMLLTICYLVPVALVGLTVWRTHLNPTSLVWRVIVLFVCILYVLYALTLPPTVVGLVQQTVAVMFDIMVWIISLQVSQRSPGSTFFVVAFFKAFYLVGALSGVVLGGAMMTMLKVPQILVMSALALVIVAIYLFVLDGRDLDALVQRYSDAVNESSLKNMTENLAKSRHLTERESEVLALMAQGRSNERIAQTLYLAIGTVNVHQYHIFQKLGVHNRQELLDLYVDR